CAKVGHCAISYCSYFHYW
nr:immunoglobulin heavy chain junction region [Macaca mulatta]MOY21764.1 immunoglobulin heavy chain junction region [Macaca mulatta]MOY22174.1 immunoglobulin heavy chain junction region [Macaca mulatta]MOY23209.1 immunoglobulin heavy chain junction region [Macaca mulatta]MOY23246.1 immunoglobulin heavy chain junction region [Macaca mulatta]